MTEQNIIKENSNSSINKFNPSVLGTETNDKKKNINRIYGRNEILDGEYKLYQQLLAELIASSIFVYGVCGSCLYMANNETNLMLSCAFIGGINIYIFGRISGAHFNPAVSLALFIRKKLTFKKFVFYVITQFIGGFIGCIVIALCRCGKFDEMAANQISNYLIQVNGGKRKAWCYISAFISEIVGTFILILFVLASCEKDNYLGAVQGIGVSITLISLSVLGANISSFSLNPIRSLPPALVQVMAGGDNTPIKQIWIYIAGPFLGSALAAFIWPVFIYQ